MVRFRFTVNKSFLDWPTHPITVPKSKVDYTSLEDEGLDDGELRIQTPDGSTSGGLMYSGKAGYGFYYQIRMNVPDGHSLLSLPIGSELIVELERNGKTSLVRLHTVD